MREFWAANDFVVERESCFVDDLTDEMHASMMSAEVFDKSEDN